MKVFCAKNPKGLSVWIEVMVFDRAVQVLGKYNGAKEGRGFRKKTKIKRFWRNLIVIEIYNAMVVFARFETNNVDK